MPRFLIEVPHDGSMAACKRAIDTFQRTGSQFLARADWGCSDGDHKAWMIVDVASKDEARQVVPPEYRVGAKVVALTTFPRDDLQAAQRQHRS
jgi:hypothetical protein